MISIAQKPKRFRLAKRHHRQFLQFLPGITRVARHAFRRVEPELRAELVAECIANAYVAFVGLVQQGRADVAYPTVLAMYAVRQIRCGRKVGSRLNVCDVTSIYCQQRNGRVVERLDRFDREEMGWQEVLVEDRHAGPAATAASRIDFAAWLQSLSRRRRKIATTLASGESTTAVAKKFGVTLGRISQLRRELQNTWEAFVGEQPSPKAA